MITQDRLTERLDELEENLPPIASKTISFGRATTRRTTSIATAIIGEVSERVDTVVSSFQSAGSTTAGQATSVAERSKASVDQGVAEVTGQAKSVFERTATVARDGARQVAGQAESAVRRSSKVIGDGAAEVAGQAKAQTRRAVDTAERETSALLDDATDSVDPDVRSVASLDDLTKAELYAKAQDRDIEGRASMSKGELISALRR